jgi:hypothetical protein
VSVSLPELLGTLGLLCLVYVSLLPAKSIPAGEMARLATDLPAALDGSVFDDAPPEFLFERARELCEDAIMARSIRRFTTLGGTASLIGIILRAGPEMPSYWLVMPVAVLMAAWYLLEIGKFSCRFPEEPLEHGLSSAMLEGVMHHGEQQLP